MTKKIVVTLQGKGPTLSYALAVQQNLKDLIVEVAEKNAIPFQRLASSRFMVLIQMLLHIWG